MRNCSFPVLYETTGVYLLPQRNLSKGGFKEVGFLKP